METLKLNDDSGNLVQVGVYNKTGDLVFRHLGHSEVHQLSDVMEVSSLPSGEYYIIIQDSFDVTTDKLVIG